MCQTLWIILIGVSLCSSAVNDWSFPPGFKFGAASASYQVEGAWNVSDKAESTWDRLTHRSPERIADGSTGDVACDSYHKYKTDVKLLADMGLHFYRFSISWPRLMPTFFSRNISEDGRQYYDDLINELLAHGIEPVVTMYHWDMPQAIQEHGGWTNPLIVKWFGDYARILYSLYGDRVKTWLTINEPIAICEVGYNAGGFAPGIVDQDRGSYLCSKNVLMAHAKAWRIYDEEFKPKHGGKVALANQLVWFEGRTKEDEDLANLALEYCNGLYSHPIYSQEGGWPPAIEKIVDKRSRSQGYFRSRLPVFTRDEIEYIKGTFDFYGLNFYTSRVVYKPAPGEQLRPWILGDAPELGAKLGIRENWTFITETTIAIYPPGMRYILKWLKDNYGDINIFIAENGYPSKGLNLEDDDRIQYLNDHMKQMLLAIKEDGVNVTAYGVWSFMDNFEWNSGYRIKFGLHEINFTDPELTRIPRKSARFYASVVRSNSLDVNEY